VRGSPAELQALAENEKKTGSGRIESSGSKGTFVQKKNAGWLKAEVGARIPLQILVWRSVSVRFMRALIHPRLGGKFLLGLLFWLEERFPRFFGKYGQYPLIIIRKPGKTEQKHGLE
jgi:hypothetical protein